MTYWYYILIPISSVALTFKVPCMAHFFSQISNPRWCSRTPPIVFEQNRNITSLSEHWLVLLFLFNSKYEPPVL
jgi:hypothetical protein